MWGGIEDLIEEDKQLQLALLIISLMWANLDTFDIKYIKIK